MADRVFKRLTDLNTITLDIARTSAALPNASGRRDARPASGLVEFPGRDRRSSTRSPRCQMGRLPARRRLDVNRGIVSYSSVRVLRPDRSVECRRGDEKKRGLRSQGSCNWLRKSWRSSGPVRPHVRCMTLQVEEERRFPAQDRRSVGRRRCAQGTAGPTQNCVSEGKVGHPADARIARLHRDHHAGGTP